MDQENIRAILVALEEGTSTVDEVIERLKYLPFEPIAGHSHLDHQRSLQTGFPEVIFAQGKTPGQVLDIFLRLQAHNRRVLATRVSPDVYAQIQNRLPEAIYNSSAACLYVDRDADRPKPDGIIVLSAGTADMAVAEEAAITAELMGNRVARIYDVGVAGLHRLINYIPQIEKANVIVVVAGMEGALPSVVGGLVSAPLIAVPTSVGYGASFHGLAALLGMLNSCASGVAVVNIDNGYGAGCMAARINSLANRGIDDGSR